MRRLDERSSLISRSFSISSWSQSHLRCIVRWHLECLHVNGWILSSLTSCEQSTLHSSVRWWTVGSGCPSVHDNPWCFTNQIRSEMDATPSASFIRGKKTHFSSRLKLSFCGFSSVANWWLYNLLSRLQRVNQVHHPRTMLFLVVHLWLFSKWSSITPSSKLSKRSTACYRRALCWTTVIIRSRRLAILKTNRFSGDFFGLRSKAIHDPITSIYSVFVAKISCNAFKHWLTKINNCRPRRWMDYMLMTIERAIQVKKSICLRRALTQCLFSARSGRVVESMHHVRTISKRRRTVFERATVQWSVTSRPSRWTRTAVQHAETLLRESTNSIDQGLDISPSTCISQNSHAFF